MVLKCWLKILPEASFGRIFKSEHLWIHGKCKRIEKRQARKNRKSGQEERDAINQEESFFCLCKEDWLHAQEINTHHEKTVAFLCWNSFEVPRLSRLLEQEVVKKTVMVDKLIWFRLHRRALKGVHVGGVCHLGWLYYTQVRCVSLNWASAIFFKNNIS